MSALSSETFTFEAIRGRRSVRRFSAEQVPDQLVLELLALANRAPSGFNLQPWHFIVVRDPRLKELLFHIAMEQSQIVEAPLVVVFVADPMAWKDSYEEVLKLGREMMVIDKARESTYRKRVRLLFRTGPFGIFGFLKKLYIPIRRLFRPTPHVITSEAEAADYVRMQTMLAASTFMIAASAAGLGTCPMEGFDEGRLKRLLAIPSKMTIPVIIPIGYPLPDGSPVSVRLALEDKVSVDLFHGRLKKQK